MALTRGRYHSFLVRLWSRDREELVHGEVVHVGTGQRIRFRDFQRMMAFIRSNLAGRQPDEAEDDGRNQP